MKCFPDPWSTVITLGNWRGREIITHEEMRNVINIWLLLMERNKYNFHLNVYRNTVDIINVAVTNHRRTHTDRTMRQLSPLLWLLDDPVLTMLTVALTVAYNITKYYIWFIKPTITVTVLFHYSVCGLFDYKLVRSKRSRHICQIREYKY